MTYPNSNLSINLLFICAFLFCLFCCLVLLSKSQYNSNTNSEKAPGKIPQIYKQHKIAKKKLQIASKIAKNAKILVK